MKSSTRTLIIYLLLAVFIGGCMSMGGEKGGGISPASPHFAIDSYSLIEQSAPSRFGCEFDYRVYQPDSPSTKTSVMIGHGFLRDQDNMVELSRAVANTGVRVVTLDFCNMRVWNGHHERNALDMRDLATSLGISSDIIFAGFSAGALAALLAADDSTRAIMTLDLVDQAQLGTTAIANLSTPLVGLAGAASGCNANNNGVDVYNSRSDTNLSELLKIDSASHCEFESPSNWLCEAACGDEDSNQAATIQRASIIQRVIDMLAPYLSPASG